MVAGAYAVENSKGAQSVRKAQIRLFLGAKRI